MSWSRTSRMSSAACRDRRFSSPGLDTRGVLARSFRRRHSSTAFRRVMLATTVVEESSRPVSGDVRCPRRNHSSIAYRSYVCPSAAT